jgi:hypothetical protein
VRLTQTRRAAVPRADVRRVDNGLIAINEACDDALGDLRDLLRRGYRFASQFANWKIVMTITTTITMKTIATI